jgi:CheY-like chemotaxis protein
VVTDLSMPQVTGMDLAREIRRAHRTGRAGQGALSSLGSETCRAIVARGRSPVPAPPSLKPRDPAAKILW